MITLSDLVHYLDGLLKPKQFKDYCPNGLQVAGRKNISRIITGVTASQNLLNAAVENNADAILVHHGYFWKNEDPCITGIKYNRLETLIKNNISLLAYHLPLDVHPAYGNNVQLGKLLNIKLVGHTAAGDVNNLISLGEFAEPKSNFEFVNHIEKKLGRKPFYVPGSKQLIQTIAWCTGAGQDFIDIAVTLGVDAYLTGEVSERTVHIAQETNIHFFAAGHHATERYGIASLGRHIAEQFQLSHDFIDIDNPI